MAQDQPFGREDTIPQEPSLASCKGRIVPSDPRPRFRVTTSLRGIQGVREGLSSNEKLFKVLFLNLQHSI